MKPLLRLIKGGKPPKMKFASFGRDRDISMIEQYVADPKMKARWIRQTSAAHDLNDGVGSVEAFIEASRDAVFPVTQANRDTALTLLARIAAYYPECLTIWDELALSSKWSDRFTVACRLYTEVPEAMSDGLFSILRHDQSKRVRDIANSRYEWRVNHENTFVKMYDAGRFDDRVKSGEVQLLRPARGD